jgi:iron complex outermembrane receptor protein
VDGVERGLAVQASYRTFRDRFLWDVRKPGVFENTHRTHAALATATGRATLKRGWQLNGGLEQAADWIRSTNLGDHDLLRTGVFAEAQGPVGARATVAAGLRMDAYTTFGVSWSPSVSGSYWLTSSLRARGSLARAFRVPTFTERFYTDPAHRANSDLEPETSWGAEAALDWIPRPQWVVTTAVFDRHDRNVIDWVKAAATDVWQTRNIRNVRTRGAELGVRRAIGTGATFAVNYAFNDVDPSALALLSKYTLDYARHAFVVSGGTSLGGGFSLGGRVDVRQRTGREAYTLLDLRLSRRFGSVTLFADGTNLLDTPYQEVRGVPMPGRWLTAGVQLARR